MNLNRFDHLSRIFARRGSRRGLMAGGLGIASAAVGTRAFAQEAAPTVDPNDPHPSADDTTVETEFLFVQPFESGTWTPKDGEDGMYTLTLSGADANTVYFSDRPERIVGLAPNQQFLDGLGFPPDNPPNAAVVAARGNGSGVDGSDHEVLVIELYNPVYDPGTGTLAYEARVLADYGEQGLAHLAGQQQDYEFGETFEEGSLFIDGCSSRTITCHDKTSGITIGKAESKMCMNYVLMQCEHCKTAAHVCGNAYPDRCGKDANGNWQCGN